MADNPFAFKQITTRSDNTGGAVLVLTPATIAMAVAFTEDGHRLDQLGRYLAMCAYPAGINTDTVTAAMLCFAAQRVLQQLAAGGYACPITDAQAPHNPPIRLRNNPAHAMLGHVVLAPVTYTKEDGSAGTVTAAQQALALRYWLQAPDDKPAQLGMLMVSGHRLGNNPAVAGEATRLADNLVRKIRKAGLVDYNKVEGWQWLVPNPWLYSSE